jgi:hypothetical protein
MSELSKWVEAGTTLDRTRDSLRNQQPPRDDVAVPRVDDCVAFLVEEITIDDPKEHAVSTNIANTYFPRQRQTSKHHRAAAQ